ncbi:MAG: ABC transporter ATP-binding protein [candidate division Zixibacteria bacterium]|nr:ABC transporter ATP-binding protein [Candidatus Tariuqbacter arcticus]
MSTAVKITDLTRFFGETVGIQDLDLSVSEGEIFGFLGPNGAGKTTTIRLLMNFIRPNRGSIEILGEELNWGDYRYHRNIGYLPGEAVLPGGFTGEALLGYWSSLSGGEPAARKRALEALAFPAKDLKRKAREYSRGMKQKLGIIGAIQHFPKLLILDEPTSGLDPLVKHSFLELLKEMKAEGRTIFFSSHILSEVEHIADTAAIIREGKLVTKASIEDMKAMRHKNVRIHFSAASEAEIFLERYPCASVKDGKMLSFISDGNLKRLLEALQGIDVVDLNISDPDLEEIFLQYYEVKD